MSERQESQVTSVQQTAAQYVAAGVCVLTFVAAQTFQELAYRLWIPEAHDPQSELLSYLLRVDQYRALLVMGSIVLLIVPYSVLAFRCWKAAPMASLFGLIFGAAFIGFEISSRSIDFFAVGLLWAHQLQAASTPAGRQLILGRFELWNEILQGWYFPLLLAHLISSASFAVATWQKRSGWLLLAPLAFALNALRLLGRLLAMFAGQLWLDPLNNKAYFPVVLVINSMLALWFFLLARHAGDELWRGGYQIPR